MHVAGADILLMPPRGQGAICQQPWREIQDKTAPLPAPAA